MQVRCIDAKAKYSSNFFYITDGLEIFMRLAFLITYIHETYMYVFKCALWSQEK